jgi:hypothetical protein
MSLRSLASAAYALILEAAATLSIVDGTNAQTLRIYGTSSSSNTNFERLTIAADAWTDPNGIVCHYIGAESGGTGGGGKGICLSPTATNYVYVRGYGVFMPDGGTFASNLIYTTGWINVTAQTPGWGFYTNYASNLVQFKASALQATNGAYSSPFVVWGIDTLNQRMGVLNISPSYPLDVTGDVNTSTKYRIGGNIVLSGQSTGYGTPTGASKLANFPGATATLAQTSAALAQLILDLKAGLMPAA